MLPKSLKHLRIDMNLGQVRKSIAINQNSSLAPTLNIYLVDAGNPVDLTNLLYAEIFIHKADDHEAINGCVIDGDSIQYTLHSTDVSAVGINRAQIQLTWKDGSVAITPTFEIVVYQAVLDERVQQSFNEYTSLSQMVVQCNGYKDAAEASKIGAELSATSAETSATAAASSAEASASSATAAQESATSANESAIAAGQFESSANTSASDANGYSEDAEAWAIGKRAGEAVDEEDETYHNNSKYYAETAGTKASEASTSASNAAESEDNALDYAQRAEEAYRKMGEEGLVLGETANTAYRGDRGKAAYEHSQTTGNPHATTYNEVGADQAGAAAAAYQQAAGYTDLQIANLINGAPQTLDTLKEIADAMAESQDVVDALQAAIGDKADEADFTGHANNSTIHITSQERTLWNGITALTQRVADLEDMLGYPISNS